MKKLLNLAMVMLLVFSLAEQVRADSRAWPPSAYSLSSNGVATVIRFVPNVKGNTVLSTRVTASVLDEKSARYNQLFDRELKGFWEPTYAALAKNPNVLICIFCRPGDAVVIIDTTSGKIIASKTFSELVPELETYDYRSQTTSTLRWCEPPVYGDTNLLLVGGLLDEGGGKRGPSFRIDLQTYEITRQR